MYKGGIKRLLDTFFASVGLLCLIPFFFVIAIVIKLSSPGPVFYRQERVGKSFAPFYLFKFRSMVVDADQKGLGITAKGDARITPIGRVLRRLKLDELPQLINVILGDMALVGPRPEIPKYVECAFADYKILLTVRPGITDAATLKFRHEESILAQYKDKEAAYISHVLPEKISLSKDYVNSMSFWGDMKIIFQTVMASFFR